MQRFLFLFLIFVISGSSWATDVIRLPSKDRLTYNSSYAYESSLIIAALDATKDEYGEYQVQYAEKHLPRARTLKMLALGETLNVVPMATSDEWESKTTPIFFPILKGIIGYRLLLVNKANLAAFSQIQTLEQLKMRQAGQDFAWSSGKAMKKMGFNMYNNSGYEMLLKMLDHNRYDYFPHGIHEIDSTLELANKNYEHLVIEPTKLLLIYQPAFLFVSPKAPHLKTRLEKGLWKILANGVFDKLFNAHFNTTKMAQDVASRTIFYAIPKNLYEKHPEFNNPKLWFLGWPSHALLKSK